MRSFSFSLALLYSSESEEVSVGVLLQVGNFFRLEQKAI